MTRTFYKIEDVTCPELHSGQEVQILSNGKWVDARCNGVTMYKGKDGRKIAYTWMYHFIVRASGVSVARWSFCDIEQLFRPIDSLRRSNEITARVETLHA